MDTNAFPDIRWGHDRRLLKKPLNAFVSSRIGSWYLRKLTPIDRKLLAHSKGRRTIFGPMGVPLLLLATTGRKTGQPRTTPLTYMREGGRLFLVGSNFGRPHHPAWSENLLANREATVTIAGAEIPVNTTLLTGQEAESVFEQFVEYNPTYSVYKTRTARNLRVFALERRQT
ncbi:nitroreductase family deazaflavin-dependent oxidoreductase [Rhodococcus sp. BH5]|uniref:nitroreductase family deazaflavin-dependent oxidoreductase n=1 Tax=Rhodococcus sp. BH5 TaxID=2871702 RepID=UPI0022CD531A|nr:nitroreductase family deazaflavin-dependent oxidoreductase [Rhodococcus sp. BH5]MCZ9631208.1 nitroreductase family deazaflavin-dependent oxidoreductase [Rhodococcus sp. BH5]